jgi:hypothetical protein
VAAAGAEAEDAAEGTRGAVVEEAFLAAAVTAAVAARAVVGDSKRDLA